MIAIINILSFLVIALTAGYLLKVTLSDMLPFVWCGIILVLYVLAFGRALNLIDILMPLTAVALLVIALRSDRASFGEYARNNLLSTAFITYALLCIALPFAQSGRVVTWWDDINYWASDLKSLYYMGGFAGRYANVSPQFGDYPPAVQLAKWFTVHMDPHAFRESLAFTGYYLFNLSFIIPLFKRVSLRRVYLCPLLALAAWGFAGIGDIFGYGGFCADLSMAYLFGSILIDAVSIPDSGEYACARLGFYNGLRAGVFLAVLVITKSTGPIWALCGLIIWIVYRFLNVTRVTKTAALKTIAPAAGPVLTGASWMLFCLIRHRVTQTTATMVTYVTTDKYGLSPYKEELKSAFVRAFFTEPVHVDHTWMDLSPAAMFLVITALLIVLAVTGRFPEGRSRRSGRFLCIALPVMGAVYYALIFLAHLTIFATETQYTEPEGMIASIERYGAPFIIGCMLFIAYVWMSRGDERFDVKVFLICVLALTNIPAAYKGLWGYRQEVKEELKNRKAFIDQYSVDFLKCIGENIYTPGDDPGKGTRICRIRDGAYYLVADTYVAYEASPVSVMCPSMDIKNTAQETFVSAVASTHATYLYADWQPYTGTYLDEMTPDGVFEYKTLYRIGYEDGCLMLYPVGE